MRRFNFEKSARTIEFSKIKTKGTLGGAKVLIDKKSSSFPSYIKLHMF